MNLNETLVRGKDQGLCVFVPFAPSMVICFSGVSQELEEKKKELKEAMQQLKAEGSISAKSE